MVPLSEARQGAERGAGHYPYQAPIDAYGAGGFRFAGMSHRGSLLCLPSGMHAWWGITGAQLRLADFAPVFGEAERIEVCFVGLGGKASLLPAEIRSAFRERGIVVEAVATGSAVRTYNILLAEGRAVAAALVAVDAPR